LYTQFFQLREMPFSITPDPAYLYMSPRHQEALGHLLYGTGQYGGFVQLTGEVGTGKTTIVRTLLEHKLPDVDVAMIHNPRQSELEFVQSLCDELRVHYEGAEPTLKVLNDALNQHLLAAHAAGRRTVLIIDEAQNLKPEVLEQVRLLTNLETPKEKLLRIMLIGQPELSVLLARPDLRQLAQRITARYHLMPLGANETAEYIAHRLRVAGGRIELFTPSALRAVYRYSRGIPRLINIICDRALLGAYAKGLNKVTPDIVKSAAKEAMGELPGIFDPTAAKRWRLIETGWAVAVVICAGLFIYYYTHGDDEPAPPAPVAPTHVAAAPVAAAPPPDASAAPEPVLVPRVQTARLSQLDQTVQPLTVVMGRLIRLWDSKAQITRGENICAALHKAKLECYRSKGNWADLGQMNRPAILTLNLPNLGTQNFLLRELGTSHAGLETALGTLRFSLDDLDKVWNGEFLVLWRRETPEVFIGPETTGESIRWVWNRLADLAGSPPPAIVNTTFDEPLRAALARFQIEHGLIADGVVGIRTLIALGENQPNTPTLKGGG
jgi:general secretion pathway protein A